MYNCIIYLLHQYHMNHIYISDVHTHRALLVSVSLSEHKQLEGKGLNLFIRSGPDLASFQRLNAFVSPFDTRGNRTSVAFLF